MGSGRSGALGLLAVFLRRHLPEKLRLRAAVMLFSLCAGLVYYGGYQNLVQRPVLDRCGREAAFSATVENYGQLTERGAKVTVYLDGLRGAKRFAMGTRPWRLWSRDRGLPAGPNGRMRAASMKTT